jgi:hypothetical protein
MKAILLFLVLSSVSFGQSTDSSYEYPIESWGWVVQQDMYARNPHPERKLTELRFHNGNHEIEIYHERIAFTNGKVGYGPSFRIPAYATIRVFMKDMPEFYLHSLQFRVNGFTSELSVTAITED